MHAADKHFTQEENSITSPNLFGKSIPIFSLSLYLCDFSVNEKNHLVIVSDHDQGSDK